MEKITETAKKHLSCLCEKIDNRCVGSMGNLEATEYFKNILEKNDWQIEKQEFEAFDWDSDEAFIETNGDKLTANSSPYSEACDLDADTEVVSTIEELAQVKASGKILILKDELTREQLMPKNFIFYNPDHHKRIISLLEESGSKGLIFIVSKSGFYEGGEYPFPIIEDGDFKIPSVYISEEKGDELLEKNSGRLRLVSGTRRSSSKGYNIIGRKGKNSSKKITITAHIDAKKGSPGAIDNATGVATMLLLSELLKDYDDNYQLELIAFNGEDYYSVPGQMEYIGKKQGDFSDISFNINIDGVGLNKGKTSWSPMDFPEKKAQSIRSELSKYPGLVEGKPWVQGDHSIFLQFGVPAIAISSEWLLENLETQRITHTENDNTNIVDIDKITELAKAIRGLIQAMQ
ncbi:MAG: M28 family peptidase [Bacteroidota bacterium]